MSKNSKKRRDAKKARQKSTHSQSVSTQSSQSKTAPSTASAGKSGQKQPVKKQRGTWLTVALAIVTAGAVLSVALPFIYRRQDIEISNPTFLGGVILVGLLGLVGVIGMWLWKRWGIYLFIASAFGSAALGFLVYPSQIVAFQAFVPVLILGAALSVDKKLPLFD